MLVLVLIILAVVITLIVSYIAYRKAFYSDRREPRNIYKMSPGMTEEDFPKMKELIDRMLARDFEWVYITSDDGLKLAARYYHVADGAPVQIHCHGYRGTSIRDFSGGNKLSHEIGHNALVIDERACGRSEGHTITFGIKERYDVLRWIDYVIDRFGEDVEIILCGVSMGSSTVLMAAGLGLPPNVKGITADCPFSGGEKIIQKVCGDMGLPPKIMTPFIRLGARLFGHFNLNETTVIEAVKNKNVPVLLIHGEKDSYVPYEMSQEIYEAAVAAESLNNAADSEGVAALDAQGTQPEQNAQAEQDVVEPEQPSTGGLGNVTIFESYPDADHGLSYIVHTERYTKMIYEFINDCLR